MAAFEKIPCKLTLDAKPFIAELKRASRAVSRLEKRLAKIKRAAKKKG